MTSIKKQSYSKMDPVDHILHRPDTYVGSTRLKQVDDYIASTTNFTITKKNITYPPALLRIFVEPLSNAIDNVAKSISEKTPCTKIKVTIDKETGKTSIWNDGKIISIEMNEEQKCYNHSLIFGQLLTSSNYNDEEERYNISGRNGLGVKLTNIFSDFFTIKGLDQQNKKTFEQEWTKNMKIVSEPRIKKTSLKKGYTEIEWIPDFKKFGMDGYSQDIIDLYCRYVIDASMLTNVSVYFNDILIPVKNLKEYSKLFLEPVINDKKQDLLFIDILNAQVVILPSTSYQYISFVNGVYTSLGGTHVDSWTEAAFRPIVDKLSKTKGSFTIGDVRKFFKIFISVQVINPEFESQNKHKLESPVVANIREKDITSILKWSIINEIKKSKEVGSLKKLERKKKNFVKIDGLDPANNDGTKYAHDCSLILVEGLSAKTYAVQGIEVGLFGKIGRDWNGIYALRGKVLNTRNAKVESISKNIVISDIIKALGVKTGVDYTLEHEFKTLRYGKIVMITDADCFTPYTPLLLKNIHTNYIDIVTIETFEESYTHSHYKIWSANEWTSILGIRKKKHTKKIIEINTSNGLLHCTVDHKCILENGDEMLAQHIKIGHSLLQIPILFESYNSNNISLNEAYLWGLIFKHGTFTKNHISIDILSTIHLNKYKCLFTKLQEYKWHIIENCSEQQAIFYKLLITDKQGCLNFVSELKNKFYSKQYKKIPIDILNGCSELIESFLLGYIYDEYPDFFYSINESIECTIIGQIGTKGLCYLFEKLGYCTTIYCTNNIYCISISKIKFTFQNTVMSTKILHSKYKFVYDIETDNHSLNAGIGSMIVHNCDGIHIKGLLLNLFHHLFPSLLQRQNSFLTCMQTPIVRVYLPNNKEKLFYDEREYQKYVETFNNNYPTTLIHKKYYKGLGSSSNKDIMDTFGKKMITFVLDDKTTFNMNKIFHSNQSDARKKWLEQYNSTNIVLVWDENKHETLPLSISDFLNTELILFSLNDCKRSIPNMMDGLKESHRKTLFACFEKNLKYSGKSLKVAQLAGYVAEKTSYHHGEQNLYDTITKMANEFPGSNNIPLLYRDGQFGSILQGGKDCANARYINTKLDALTRFLFRQEDDVLLDNIIDDGDTVEPKFYVPILPTVLINGIISGIGTGWSCSIPSYNPIDIIKCVKLWLHNNCTIYDDKNVSILPNLIPWYRGYKGLIEKVSHDKYSTWGNVSITNNKKIVDELPVGMWTDNFKEYLDGLLETKVIKNVKNYSTPTKVHFVIKEEKDGMICTKETLKLQKYLYTSNMVFFNSTTSLKKYNSIDEIIHDFCIVRYSYYSKRKTYILLQLEKKILFLNNKKRFLQDVMSTKLTLLNSNLQDICTYLETNGYDKENVFTESKENNYDYLLNLPFKSMTSDHILKLTTDIHLKQTTFKNLTNVSEKELWLNDINEFEIEYLKWLKSMNNP